MKGYPSKETVPTRFWEVIAFAMFSMTLLFVIIPTVYLTFSLGWNNVRTHVDWAEVIIPPMLLAAGVVMRRRRLRLKSARATLLESLAQSDG